MEEKKGEGAAVEQAQESRQEFEFTISARGSKDGVAAKLSISGRPASGTEMEAVAMTVAARSLAFLYDAALVGTGRQDTPAERALFVAGMQPQLLRTFFGLTDSWQFQKALSEHREAAIKSKEEKKES